MLVKPSQHHINRVVQAALEEDAPWGDLTSQTLIPAAARITAKLVAREPGTFCGEDLLAAAFHLTDPSLHLTQHIRDAQTFTTGTTLAEITGSARAILQAERIALNFTQRLSGIATLTAQYVTLASTATNPALKITDTRKTTPGLRQLERYAVRCGGGHNHRFSLSDAVMVKDNHLASLATDITTALLQLRRDLPHTTSIEVEVDRPDQIESVLAAHPDTILLDNFTPTQLTAAVTQIAGRALVEASGGITLTSIPAIAATGVDIISIGALTHSVRALDLGLDIDCST